MADEAGNISADTDGGAYSTAMVDKGDTGLPTDGVVNDADDGKDQASKELDDAHAHADPDRDAGLQRANVDPVNKGFGVSEVDKKM